MIRPQALHSVNLQALTEAGAVLIERTPLRNLERLAPESIDLNDDSIVTWEAKAELRPGATGRQDIWLHVQAFVSMSLTCQRCLTAVKTPLKLDQWCRFVASEEVAMAEDDGCDEDLLVMTPQFDLLALLEDELLMAMPLVPMHDQCPVMPAFSSGLAELPTVAVDKPNPFAALARLKKNQI